jgi:SAM-dependent methyltransferase
MHQNCILLFQKYALQYFTPGMKVLEIGPDDSPSSLQRLVPIVTWDTVDLVEFKDAKLTYRAQDEYTFPISNNEYDIVVSANVIEHVRKPWIWMKEVTRVTKPRGKVVTINPVSWPYHLAPIDCWRCYPEGMRALYEDAGLKVLHSSWESLEKVNSSRRMPGKSKEWQSRKKRFAHRVLGLIGFPDECAFDTITIGER